MKFFVLGSLLFISINLTAQVNLTVTVNSTSAGTNCGDFIGGAEPTISLQIDSESTYYYESGSCPSFEATAPFNQYSNSFNCSANYPSSLQFCMQAYEDDGICADNVECLELLCQNYTVPAPGNSISYSIEILNDGLNGSWGAIDFTITATGSFLNVSNDLICNSIDLGTLSLGGTNGNGSLSNYSNYCSSNTSDPNPGWSNEQGVWFSFTTGAAPSMETNFSAFSDPQGLGDNIDLQLALYESDNNTCSGSLTLVQESYDGSGLINDEEMTVNCISPNTTYFLLVDGEFTATFNTGGAEGLFGIEIQNTDIEQAGDEICDASNLGTVSTSGSIATATLSQSNLCANNTNDPAPFGNSNNGVWYQFQAPASGNVLIEANSDLPFPIGTDEVDIVLSIYESSDNSCSGVISIIDSSYASALFDEDMTVFCLTPSQNYWIMVSGSGANPTGIFDLTISDNEMVQAGDEICDGEDLGPVPALGSVGTTTLSQVNYCATNTNDPTPFTTTNKAVWYQFQAPSTGTVIIEATSDNIFGDPIDLQFALYETDNNSCSGALSLIDTANTPIIFNEVLTVGCLVPGQNYWIMVDGNLIESTGIFDITVLDAGFVSLIDSVTDSHSACDSYTWIDGNTYTSTNNTSTHILTNTAGCDSVITLDLSLAYSTSFTDVQSACDSLIWIDGNTYTVDNNTAIYTLTNSAGCDSIISLDLSITSIDSSVTQTGLTLSANTTGDSYQWVDCDDNYSAISGATDQSYAAESNGTYAVIITLNGCSDTSGCFIVEGVGMDDFSPDNISIYPNPTEDILYIKGFEPIYSQGVIEIYAMTGEVLFRTNQVDSKLDVSFLESGTYMLNIIQSEQKRTFLFVKQ